MRKLARVFLMVAGIVMLSGGLVHPVLAGGVVGDGTPSSCNDTTFTNVLSGGGTVTFDCGGTPPIILTSTKTISADTVIDGGGQITLSGANVIRLFSVNSPATLTLTNITLTNGFNLGDGGTIFNGGTLVLNHSTIQNGLTSSQGSGGAIVTYGPLTITDSMLTGNRAANGGALYVRGGHTTIRNSVFDHNATTGTDPNMSGWGGAMLLWDGVSVDIEGGEFANNTALVGGGIYNNTSGTSGHLQLEDVVIADSPSGGNCGGAVPDSASFALSSDATCTLTGIGSRSNTPALLGPLQDNGGGLLTLLPQPMSPLIDSGLCVAGVSTDERGLLRPQGAACDIGAVEVQPNDRQYHIYLPLVVR